MPKLFYSHVRNACVLLISIFGFFVKPEVAKYKVTEWGRCPDSNKRYLVIPNVSIGECAYQCRIRPICKSVGYSPRLHLCDIFSEEELLLLSNPGKTSCLFIHNKDIEQDNTPCSCEKDGNCSIKECATYNATNVEILGNRNHVGAMVKATCKAGWNAECQNDGTCKAGWNAECQNDGTWSHMPECTPSKCPTNQNPWIHPVNDTTFKIQINVERFNHSTAQAKCISTGARLVRIDEKTKLEYVADILRSCENLDKKNYWTDGTNTHLESSSDRVMRFSNGDTMPLGNNWWQSGRPVKEDSSMCARLQHSHGFLWRDAYCIENDFFICEKVN